MHNVIKTYGPRTALAGIDLDVDDGETVAIMGPSGCGKSTLLRSIIRLVEPDSGEITWRGQSVIKMAPAEMRQYRRETGYVFQRSNLVSRLNVLQNVMLPAAMLDGVTAKVRSDATWALEAVGMGQYADEPVSGLSGGEMQRVAIARAIAGRPGLILWDEPTASLDPILVVDVLKLIEELIRSLRRTMIIVTHETGFALRVADRVVLMECGSIAEEGRPDQVFVHPRSSLGRRYAECLAYSAEARYMPDGVKQENENRL